MESEEDTEMEETEIIMWPVWVNPNFSKKDHGAGVGGDGQGFDLGGAVGEEEEAEGQFRHFGGWCGETGEEIGVVKGAKGEDRVGAKDARQ
jgi:hypothetical protein